MMAILDTVSNGDFIVMLVIVLAIVALLLVITRRSDG